ncbi:MAG: phytoene desaturase family protein [Acidobacteriaceae bacterium]
MPPSNAKQIIVIGAGPGGLAASILLAAAGLDVTILERASRVGGRTAAIEAEGFRFDTGPTFFLYPKVLREILAAGGFCLDREIEMRKLDPQYRLVFGSGGELSATPDLKRMETAILALTRNPADADGFRNFYKDNKRKLESFSPILSTAFNGWTDLISLPLLRSLSQLHPWRSLDEELQQYFQDPRLRLAFSFQSKYLGMSPFRCPSLFSILSFLEYEHGVFHPIGGCSAVMEMLARVAISIGVDIRLSEEVTGIDVARGRVSAVHTAEHRYVADKVVINADFAHAMRSLLPTSSRRRWTDARIERKKFSCSTFMLYLGIDGAYDIPHHNIYTANDYQKNLRDIEQDHVLSDDPSFYVQNASVTDATLAPKGKSTLYVLAPVTHQHANVNWKTAKSAFRERVLDQLPKIGINDVRKRIRFEQITTPDDWARNYAIHKGATFSLAHSLDQMLHLRPPNRFDDVRGVYLVGGGTHPGSGLPVIFESARISSRLLLQDLGVKLPKAVRHNDNDQAFSTSYTGVA